MDQIDNLKRQQMSGDVKMIAGNVDKDYELPENEKHLVHLKCITSINDSVKRKYIDKEKIYKVEPERFKLMEKNGGFSRFDKVEIVHDPSKEPSKEEIEKAKKEAAAKKKAEKEAKAAKEKEQKEKEKAEKEAKEKDETTDESDKKEDSKDQNSKEEESKPKK